MTRTKIRKVAQVTHVIHPSRHSALGKNTTFVYKEENRCFFDCSFSIVSFSWIRCIVNGIFYSFITSKAAYVCSFLKIRITTSLGHKMASVLKKLVRRDARNLNGNIPNGSTQCSHKTKEKVDKKEEKQKPKETEDQNIQESSATSSNSSEVAPMCLSHTQRVRTKRLMKEFQDVSRKNDLKIFTAELVRDNLYEWNVKLHTIDGDSLLHRDMIETGAKYILLNITFPENFPFAPPFMRVLAPRIEGGFVLDGGAICMELLTPRGWSSAYTVEAVILQFSAAVVKGKGRIDRGCKKAFSKKEAESAFKRLVKTHEKYGWVTPPKSEG